MSTVAEDSGAFSLAFQQLSARCDSIERQQQDLATQMRAISTTTAETCATVKSIETGLQDMREEKKDSDDQILARIDSLEKKAPETGALEKKAKAETVEAWAGRILKSSVEKFITVAIVAILCYLGYIAFGNGGKPIIPEAQPNVTNPTSP